MGDLGSVSVLGRSLGERKGYPLQYSGLENSVDSPWGSKELDTTERLSLLLELYHSFKTCALSTSLLFHALSRALSKPTMLLYNLLEGQPENSWPLGGKYCIISNPSRYSGLHLSCFLQHVQHQHLSVNLLWRAIGTQCLLEVHQLASLQRQLGFYG